MSHTAFRQSLACVSLLYRHEQGTNISTPLPNGITLYPTQGYADSSGADRRKEVHTKTKPQVRVLQAPFS
jgi:hypothetical protein